MHFRRLLPAAALLFVASLLPLAATAASETAYATFSASATAQHGLFTILHKGGRVYIDISDDQLDTDYLETIVPGNGIGGNFIVWGNTDHLPAMLVRFERANDGIAIVWPNSSFIAPNDPNGQLAVRKNFPQSVVGVGKIVAEGDGHIVFDASPLFKDVLDMEHIINGSLNAKPGEGYHLDPERTYFGATKAFPENVVLHVEQLWATQTPHIAPDTAPDSRSLQMDVVYNFAQLPKDHYRPRYADDRVGLYDDVYMDFSPSTDLAADRYRRYLVRWNFAPADPSKPSRATHPMVFYLSNSIPVRFRPAVRDAVLTWNQALAKVGILDAIQVKDQPNDPSWDADDIRYNVLRWNTEQRPSFGADSQTLFDPRTGEEFRTGVLISANVPMNAARTWRQIIDPVRYGRNTDPIPHGFIHDAIVATLLHETGHNLGMQHNFIGHDAYAAKQLQDPNWTATHGIATTVMEYTPLNIWPKGTGQGAYQQKVLGPYDYYAMKYAYGYIPNAPTPEAEIPTLEREAAAWSNPLYRYASDEDVAWNAGHAADPRVEQGELTDDQLGWTITQLGIYRSLMDRSVQLLPAPGHAYEDATGMFAISFYRYLGLAGKAAHFIGGQYLSRAHRGDPGAQPPIVPVPLATQRRAFAILNQYLFEDAQLTISPSVLDKLGYSEWAGYGYVGWDGYGNLPMWAYDPPARHDFPFVQAIGKSQSAAISFMFSPAVLARLEQNPMQSTGKTLTLPELFAWMHDAVFGELRTSGNISLLRRNLQVMFESQLIALATAPKPGAPADAQAQARAQLARIDAEATAKAHRSGLNEVTRAHAQLLAARAHAALKP
ncbi:MAG TPA: zinc-dependent metalloprotease [Candidatus Aquilonibacter sp.]|nr:zinc-dependent metalloprotease [Candidatus Aquilonibacter sp.]